MVQIYKKAANIQIKNWAKNLKDTTPRDIYIYVYLNAWKSIHHLSHEENANQNHSENISHHKDGYNQKESNSCLWECGGTIILIHCWWGCNLVHFGKFLVVSWNVRHKFTTQLSNSIPRNLTKKNENICSLQELYVNAYSNVIHNSLRPEMAHIHQLVNG